MKVEEGRGREEGEVREPRGLKAARYDACGRPPRVTSLCRELVAKNKRAHAGREREHGNFSRKRSSLPLFLRSVGFLARFSPNELAKLPPKFTTE